MSLAPRWRKIQRDLSGSPVRTLLVVVSIAIGAVAIGAVVGARSLTEASLQAVETNINSASASLVLDPFGDELVTAVRGTAGVRDAQGRRSLFVRLNVAPDRWRTMQLFAYPDYQDVRIDRLRSQAGAWPPPDRTLLMERASLAYLGWQIGANALVEMPDGLRRSLPIAGTLHDLNQPATNLSGVVYGYVSFATLEWLGGTSDLNELLIQVSEGATDRAHVERVTAGVRQLVEDTGRQVSQTTVPQAGRFWAYDYVQSLTLLLGLLGGLCMFLSGFLVVNTVSALIAQQVRQIGVMKAIGADFRQIVTLYLGMVVIYGMLALLVAIPLGAFGALWLVNYSTLTLNFDSLTFRPDPLAICMQVGAGLMLPLLAALQPVVAGGRISVRDAISSSGLGAGGFGEGAIDAAMHRLRHLPRPTLLSLRNTLRRKTRLALTLGTLMLAGGTFIAVLSVQTTLARTLNEIFGLSNFDLQITFDQPYAFSQARRQALAVPGVARLQAWGLHSARRVRPDRSEGGQIQISAPPAETDLLVPVLLKGRWLLPVDQSALVLNTDVLRDEPDLDVGSEVKLKIDDVDTWWRVVGLVRGSFAGPIAYANGPYVARILGDAGSARQLEIVTSQETEQIAATARALEERFKAAGLRVAATDIISERRALQVKNYDVIVSFLLSMAILLAVVGGLGLTAAMSMNVLERTREIGVMRAIGASDSTVLGIVVGEGLAIGALSWVGGVVLSIPIGFVLTSFVGDAFVHETIGFVFDGQGAVLWLAVVLVLSAAASFLPAWNATRLTVKDVLTYE